MSGSFSAGPERKNAAETVAFIHSMISFLLSAFKRAIIIAMEGNAYG